MAKRAKRGSPIEQPPLSSPGESQREHMWGVITEEFVPWLAVCVFMVVLTALEWVRWFRGTPPQPVPFTLWLVGLVIFVLVWKLPRIKRRLRQGLLGIEGEKCVAELLDSLKAGGYHVIHDIVEDGYNIDHVLIGPTGVYVIETKMRSKSAERRDVHVMYDGLHVLEDGYAPDRDPLKQVQAQADRVREVLRSRTKMSPPIRPVVLYPGWFVEKQPNGVAIWVLNPTALPHFVRNEPARCDEHDVAALVAALVAHARTASEQRV